MKVPEGIRHGKFPALIVTIARFRNLFFGFLSVFLILFQFGAFFSFLCALIANVTANAGSHRDM